MKREECVNGGRYRVLGDAILVVSLLAIPGWSAEPKPRLNVVHLAVSDLKGLEAEVTATLRYSGPSGRLVTMTILPVSTGAADSLFNSTTVRYSYDQGTTLRAVGLVDGYSQVTWRITDNEAAYSRFLATINECGGGDPDCRLIEVGSRQAESGVIRFR